MQPLLLVAFGRCLRSSHICRQYCHALSQVLQADSSSLVNLVNNQFEVNPVLVPVKE